MLSALERSAKIMSGKLHKGHGQKDVNFDLKRAASVSEEGQRVTLKECARDHCPLKTVKGGAERRRPKLEAVMRGMESFCFNFSF